MDHDAARTVISSRVLPFPREAVFDAYANPAKLVEWWGPEGFTMTVETIDLRAGGEWRFVFHGPDGKDYKNHLVFRAIERPARFVVDHISGPKYLGTVTFDEVDASATRVTMHWLFENPGVIAKIRPIVERGNEENFDRLGRLLAGL
jgi:uncharacterized protein YndB with AHSA1/START domain